MFLLFFGTIGNVLNLLIFTRKIFRNNICVNYFLASAIADSFLIISGPLPRLINGFGTDASQSSSVLCKLKFFTIYHSGYTAAWFTCLACIERYLSSSESVRRRHLITMKRAKLSMVFVLLFGIIIFGEQFHCIDINQNLYGAPQSCNQLKRSLQCQIADNAMQFTFEMFIPAVLMTTFGVLTVRNVRQRKRRVHVANTTKRSIPLIAVTNISHPSVIQQPTNTMIDPNNQPATMEINRAAQKREMQLIIMLLVQSGYAAAWFTCLACIERYLSSSVSVYKRHLITMKRAKLSMVFVLLFGIIIFGEQFHCIDINQNLYGAPQSCYQLKSNVQCQIADSLMQFIFEMFIPAVVMITFGVLTLQNVRQRKRRVNVANTTKRLVPLFAVTNISHPSVIQQSINITIGPNNQPATMGITRTAQKREMQLIMMLLMQVVVFIVSTFPISIYKIYSIATIDQTRSVLRASIENTIFNVFVLCLFLTNNINFYIYTLCGATFRKELLKLFHLANGLLPRLLGGFGMDLSQTSSVLCKLKFFTIYHSGYTAAWFTCLACIERYLSSSTSVYKRHLITMKRAKLSMIFVILFGTIVFGEQFYCIDINQNLYGAPQSCYQLKSNIQCQIADSLMQFIFEMFIPAIVMTIFGVLTLQNVRQRKRRVNVIKTTNRSIPLFALRTINHPSVTQQSINMTVGPNKQPARMEVNRTTQKREMQLIMMLLMQVAFFVVSSCPISAYKIYSIATINQARPILRASIENTVFNVCVLCSFLNNNINFYIYTLCGATFRKELLKLFRLAK
ncbi:unnamed protein product [Adineta steineri]|uniref:G-protein coupled receptors family 1 profile domain-containing protein n=1 Tax=Adineta steineri TaxID=433720 RepID=A0A813YTT7_9BILA|nr:unnamed protein product [Adineta steineri]